MTLGAWLNNHMAISLLARIFAATMICVALFHPRKRASTLRSTRYDNHSDLADFWGPWNAD